ncbi:MAG: TIGR02147 family protein [Proteobacteria bacterium]|nr:MAG: TIGR02147 family protein [Pseudomonadota bacterium]
MTKAKPTIYSYQDFATLFAAYVEWMKSVNPKFSWRWLGKRLQLKSHTHIINFANGSKAPTDEMLTKISDLFGFTIDEYVYVKSLVGLQTARNDSERIFYQNKLAETKRSEAVPMLDHDSFGLIAQWYHIVIYELVKLPDFTPEPKWISEKLNAAISPEVAEEALDRLIRLGLLSRRDDGKILRTVDGFFTTHNIPSGAIAMFHKGMLERATECIKDVPVNQRLFLGYTMPIDSKRIDDAQNLMIEFRSRFALLMEGGTLDSVYHLGMQFFPATHLAPLDAPEAVEEAPKAEA